MTKLVSGYGYQADTTINQIIAAYEQRFGYSPPDPATWVWTKTVVIVPVGEVSPVTPQGKEDEDGVEVLEPDRSTEVSGPQ